MNNDQKTKAFVSFRRFQVGFAGPIGGGTLLCMTAVNGKIFQSRFAAWLVPMFLRLVFIACIILAAPRAQAASSAAGGFTTGFLASGFNDGSPAQNLESGGIDAISGGVTGGIFGAGGGLVGNLSAAETAAFGQSYATSAEWGDLLASRYGAENVTGGDGAALRNTVYGNILANQTALAGTNLNSLAAAEAAESGGVVWNNGWRTADGRFASPLGAGQAGAAAQNAVWDAVEAEAGWQVIRGGVSVRDASGQLRVYDGAAISPSGRVIGLEVKSGSAGLTAEQRAFDSALSASGPQTVTGVGQNAGLQVRRALEVRQP